MNFDLWKKFSGNFFLLFTTNLIFPVNTLLMTKCIYSFTACYRGRGQEVLPHDLIRVAHSAQGERSVWVYNQQMASVFKKSMNLEILMKRN